MSGSGEPRQPAFGGEPELADSLFADAVAVDYVGMSRRALWWISGLITAAVVVGLIVWFAVVGLTKASQLATVIAAIVAVLALVVAAYTAVLARRAPPAADGTTHNTISGGIFHGPVWQGRNYEGRLPGRGVTEGRETRREADGGDPSSKA